MHSHLIDINLMLHLYHVTAIKADSSSGPSTGASPSTKNEVEEHQDDEMDKGTNAVESSEPRRMQK
jgi:hypothetical protein